MATTALATIDAQDVAVIPHTSALPSIADMRQKMAWLKEFRPLLKEYIEQHMDPGRHMYSFENNRYTPLTMPQIKTMQAEGKKPALNQDGIHNVMSLYDCYPDEPSIQEIREDGFYTCRATVRLISMRSGLPMGAGTGSCSTRESRYAWRWVDEKRLPSGLDKQSLRRREGEGRYGTYVQYRVPNEDLADVEATVLQMAVKRAKSAAVKALPLMSEMFATVGDPDERGEDDPERASILATLGKWMRTLKASVRAKALLAVFQEPMRAEDMQKLDVDRLAQALQVVEIAERQQVAWDSPTLVADLKGALAHSAAQAKSDLFGDAAPTTAGTNGAWRENVLALMAALPDMVTEQTPPDLVMQIRNACDRAEGMVAHDATPDSTGEAMLETLRTLRAEVGAQMSFEEYGG